MSGNNQGPGVMVPPHVQIDRLKQALAQSQQQLMMLQMREDRRMRAWNRYEKELAIWSESGGGDMDRKGLADACFDEVEAFDLVAKERLGE